MSVKHTLTRAGGVFGLVAILLGMFAGTAAAWNHPDCNGGGSHESSPPPEHHWPASPPPPAPTPPAPAPAPTPTPAPTPAPAPTPTPAPTPAPAPAPAPSATPAPTPAPTPAAPKENAAPKTPASTETHVKGRIGTRQIPENTPVSVVNASVETGKLPVTGFNVLFQVILGGLALAGGAMLFRRTSNLA